MDEYADIYYVDSRNARDHRPGRPGWTPGRSMTPSRTVYVPPSAASSSYAPAPYPPAGFPQGPVYTTQGQVFYPGLPGQSTIASMFGKLTTGQIVEMIAMAWAAMQSLPTPPTSTEEARTDVANLVTYQGALAQHAKRDEQVRTLGSLVARLLG